MSQHSDYEYLLLTLQWVERKLNQHPAHPTLKGQRDALINAMARAQVPREYEPSQVFQKAGPEAVALRKRWNDVDKAAMAIGDHFSERPEIGNDAELREMAERVGHALVCLRDAISSRLRKLCGVSA